MDVQAEGDALVEGGLRLEGRVDVVALVGEEDPLRVIDSRVDDAVADGLRAIPKGGRMPEAVSAGRTRVEMWGDVGRCGEMWGDAGRSHLGRDGLHVLWVVEGELGGDVGEGDLRVGERDVTQAGADDVLAEAHDEGAAVRDSDPAPLGEQARRPRGGQQARDEPPDVGGSRRAGVY